MTPLAVIRSYDDLADALAVERGRRGISQFNLEVAAGLQFKQVNKLEKKKKYPGKYLACWLEGLGVELLLVRRAESPAANHRDLPSNPETYRNLRKKLGAKGGRARGRNLKRDAIREIGRKGAQKRWKRRHRPSRPIGNGARDG